MCWTGNTQNIMSGPRQLYQPKAGSSVTVSLVILQLRCKHAEREMLVKHVESIWINDLKPVLWIQLIESNIVSSSSIMQNTFNHHPIIISHSHPVASIGQQKPRHQACVSMCRSSELAESDRILWTVDLPRRWAEGCWGMGWVNVTSRRFPGFALEILDAGTRSYYHVISWYIIMYILICILICIYILDQLLLCCYVLLTCCKWGSSSESAPRGNRPCKM